MDTETRPTGLKNKNDFPAFSYGLEFVNEAEKEKKTTEKETRHWRPQQISVKQEERDDKKLQL